MTTKAAVIGRGSGAQMNNRSWIREEAEKEEEEANNEHLFGDKMRFIVGRFRNRALRDVSVMDVRLRERRFDFHDGKWSHFLYIDRL